MHCRFALHRTKAATDHIDLFVPLDRTNEESPLVTFEAPVSLKDQLLLQPAMQFICEMDSEKPSRSSISNPILYPLRRKNDHRWIYWEYSGEISGGRGSLEGLGYFFVELETGCNLDEVTGLAVSG